MQKSILFRPRKGNLRKSKIIILEKEEKYNNLILFMYVYYNLFYF